MIGPRGEQEKTTHGKLIDITVPLLRLWSVIWLDEVRIIIAMAVLIVFWTLIEAWAIPLLAVTILAVLCVPYFKHALVIGTFWDLFWKITIVGLLIFIVVSFVKNPLAERLRQGGVAIWQWPPKLGIFLERVLFVTLPLFLPPAIRIPAVQDFFITTILNPNWPPPYAQVVTRELVTPCDTDEAGGVPEPEAIEPVIFKITNRIKPNGDQSTAATELYGEWLAPVGEPEGLAWFGLDLLFDRATFSERGSRSTSKTPKQGATHYGFTGNEYTVMRETGLRLGLIEKVGRSYELTDDGISVMVDIIAQTLGADSLPTEYQDWASAGPLPHPGDVT